jgi:hypothetical protein
MRDTYYGTMMQLAKQAVSGDYEVAKESMKTVVHLANIHPQIQEDDWEHIEMSAHFLLSMARRRSCANQLRGLFNYVKSEQREGRQIDGKEDYVSNIEEILAHHEMPRDYVSAVMGYANNLLDNLR